MCFHDTVLGIVTARAAALRLMPSFWRPIWGIKGHRVSRRPGGAGHLGASVEGFPAGRAAAILAMRFGGGNG